MQLDCEVCHAPLRAEDVRTGSPRLKCPTCTARERPLTRDKAARPTNIQVEESEQSTVLSWRWLSLAPHIFMALVCLVWDGSLVMVFRQMLETGIPLAAQLFSVLILGGGVVMTYATLAGFLNTTRILDEARRSPRPMGHASTRQALRELREQYRAFVAAFREAAARWRRGDFSAPFRSTPSRRVSCWVASLEFADTGRQTPAGGTRARFMKLPSVTVVEGTYQEGPSPLTPSVATSPSSLEKGWNLSTRLLSKVVERGIVG